MITYREITIEEIHQHILEVDVSEHGELIYLWQNGELITQPLIWDRPPRTAENWQENWASVLPLPGVKAWGAFEDDVMVGIIVYRPYLTEDMAQLDALFVDKHHRQQGIASHLTRLLEKQAIADGHKRLYVSATESQSAVGFYISRGFVPTQDAHPELYALEPNDIHMIKILVN
jgi:ribosomal protein S18 acetylase RimI-like enzyme